MTQRRAQSSLEFATLVIVVLAAILTMQVYFKRGLQGRWKGSTDEIGEQYDPHATNGITTFHLSGTTETKVWTEPDSHSGIWTMRQDASNTVETKDSDVRVGALP